MTKPDQRTETKSESKSEAKEAPSPKAEFTPEAVQRSPAVYYDSQVTYLRQTYLVGSGYSSEEAALSAAESFIAAVQAATPADAEALLEQHKAAK